MKQLLKKGILILGTGIFLFLIIGCGSSGAVTQDAVNKSYSEYRDGKKKALNNLISYYRDPTVPMEVRQLALQKVIESNDPIGLQAVRNSLKNAEDLDYSLFKTGLKALSKTRDPENTNTILQAMATSRASYVAVRDEMFAVIEDQVDARSVAVILKLYADAQEDYASFLQNLTLTLGKMDDARVVPVLMSIASNPKIEMGIRNLAIEILATKNDPAVARLLADMLNNPSTQDQVKTYAISVVDEMKDARLIASLIDALHDEQNTYYTMVDAITGALGDFDDPELKIALIKVAKDDQMPSRFRKRAIVSLSKFQDPETADQLIEILNNPDNFIFYNDIRTMVENIGSDDLIKKMQDVARSTQAAWERE